MNKTPSEFHAAQRAAIHQPKASPWAFGNCSPSAVTAFHVLWKVMDGKGRILDFDEAAARAYAEFMGICKEKGCPMSLPDGQIAAVAHVNRLALATRNMRDFVKCGIALINPFDQTAASHDSSNAVRGGQ